MTARTLIHTSLDIRAATGVAFVSVGKRMVDNLALYGGNSKDVIFGDIKIHASFANGFGHVRIEGGATRYEFVATDLIGPTAYKTPSNTYGVNAHAVVVHGGNAGFSAGMLASNTGLNDAPLIGAEQWAVTDAVAWYAKQAYNAQKLAINANYTVRAQAQRTARKSITYTTTSPIGAQAIAHSRNIVGFGKYPTDRLYTTGDTGWDTRQSVYANGKQIYSAQPLLTAPYWWRRGTTIETLSELGALRPISVSTDNMGNFYFYRPDMDITQFITQEGYAALYVPPSRYKKVSASSLLPPWVAIPTIDTMRGEQGLRASFDDAHIADSIGLLALNPGLGSDAREWGFPIPAKAADYTPNPAIPNDIAWAGSTDKSELQQTRELLWEFNSDGTAAAAIALEDKGVATYVMYPKGVTTPQAYQVRVMRRGRPDMWMLEGVAEQKASWIAANGGVEDVHVMVRGLVEVSIAVVITGPEPLDFTATVTTKREVRDRYFTQVGYAYDTPELIAKGVYEDNLLAAEYVLYEKPHVDFVVDTAPCMLEMSNITAGAAPFAKINLGATVQPTSNKFPTYIGTPALGNTSPIDRWNTTYAGNSHHWAYNTAPTYMDPYASNATYVDAAWHMNAIVYAVDMRAAAATIGVRGTNWSTDAVMVQYMFGTITDTEGSIASTSLQMVPTWAKRKLYVTDAELTTMGLHGATTATEYRTPYGHWAVYEAAFLNAKPSTPHMLTTHPDGHYSVYAQYQLFNDTTSKLQAYRPALDVIAHRNIDGTYSKTKHLTMFNSAFKQSRTVEQYRIGGLYGIGAPATAGLWV